MGVLARALSLLRNGHRNLLFLGPKKRQNHSQVDVLQDPTGGGWHQLAQEIVPLTTSLHRLGARLEKGYQVQIQSERDDENQANFAEWGPGHAGSRILPWACSMQSIGGESHSSRQAGQERGGSSMQTRGCDIARTAYA